MLYANQCYKEGCSLFFPLCLYRRGDETVSPECIYGVVMVLVAIGSTAREAPAHGCGESLGTNDVSEGRPHLTTGE